MRLLINILLIFIFSGVVIAQQSFDDPSRAIYIMDIAKYVTWSNEKEINTYTIGILEEDSSLYYALSDEVEKRKTLHNKPVEIKLFHQINKIEPLQVLYLHKKSGFNITDVFSKIEGDHTLLISENYPFHKSMLNFIVYKGRKRFELNKIKLEEAGLSVSDLFVAYAVKTRADWQKIYEKTEVELQKEKKVVAKQKNEIAEQKKIIEHQKEQITIQEDSIKMQREKLANLSVEIEEKQKVLKDKLTLIDQQIKAISKQKASIDDQTRMINDQKIILKQQHDDIRKQKRQIKRQNTVLAQQLKEIEKQRLILYFFIIVLALFGVLGYFIFRAYKIKKKANFQLQEKNIAIEKKNKEIARQRDIAEEQRDQIAIQNKQIMDSINYARRIQFAILPDPNAFSDILKHFFILYKPKDVVSGDFYWETKVDNKIIIVAADCTGHGVPGAFMSMLGMTFLNEIVNRDKITQPNKILNRLRKNVIDSLNQEGRDEKVRDGMDIAVCALDKDNDIIQFAGANNPMVLVRNNEVIQLKGDNMPVSIYAKMLSFTNKEINLSKGDNIYIFSDGYADQFGGNSGRKFMKKRLRETFVSIQHLSMQEQKQKLDEIFENWRGQYEQIDDVLIIGLKV